MKKDRVSKEEALSFLLSYLVVERGVSIQLDPLHLFKLTSLAQEASDEIGRTEGVIPHEVIETLAENYLAQR